MNPLKTIPIEIKCKKTLYADVLVLVESVRRLHYLN